MKNYGLKQCSLVSLLASSSLALAAEQSPFEKEDFEPRQKTSDCRILEFTCTTCGHMTDSEMWTKDNKLVADIESCEQKRREEKEKARQ